MAAKHGDMLLTAIFVVASCIFRSVTTLEVVPASALVMSGSQMTFRCSGLNSNWGTWTVHYMNGQTCQLNSGSSMQACADRNRMSVTLTSDGHTPYGHTNYVLTLTINNVNLSDAGSYVCTGIYGTSGPGSSSLTVIHSAPSGEWNPTYVVEGQNLTFTCRTSYNGSVVPRVTWTDNTGKTVSTGTGSRVSSSASDTLMHIEATLVVPVLYGTAVIQPYTCSLKSPLPPAAGTTAVTSFTWNSSAIMVSYCPRHVAIISTDDDVTMGTRLTCVAEAHPSPTYRWIVIDGTGYASGVENETMTVTSSAGSGNYFFRCLAVNYLQGNNRQPCFASTDLYSSKDQFSPDHGHHERTVRSLELSTTTVTVPPKTASTITTAPNTTSTVSIIISSTASASTDSTTSIASTRSSSATRATPIPLPTVCSALTTSSLHTSAAAAFLPSSDSAMKTTPLINTAASTSRLLTPRPRPLADGLSMGPQTVASYQTAVIVLSILMAVVILIVIIIGLVLARVVLQLRQAGYTPWSRAVGRHLSTRSITTEMSSITTDDKTP